MAENYGGVEGLLRAQRDIPESQRKESLRVIDQVIKKARSKYAKSGSRRDADDLAGAEKTREKYLRMGKDEDE